MITQDSSAMRLLGCVLALVFATAIPDTWAETLPSWRDTVARTTIVDFVERTTNPALKSYAQPSERIAVIDNDGTLWAERPVYFQLLFAVDRARQMIDEQPDLAQTSPFREIASGNLEAIAAGGEESLLELVMRTHAGLSESQFADAVEAWIGSARHPTSQRPYTAMVYQPMLELLDYLREHDFEVWIVSGGGVSFLRVWAEGVYGVPPERVIGSRLAIRYEAGALRRQATIDHINDKEGKPVGIQQQIGRRPLLAVGNSDGDLAMLEWTTSRPGPSLGILVHHTDAEREWAYDRDSHVGRLDRGLREAGERGWLLIDMRRDWRRIFPFESVE